MTSFKPGQVVLIPFPFTDLTTVKQHPALVISTDESFNSQHHDIIVLAMTSQNPFALQPDEYSLSQTDQAAAKLPKASKVKSGKIISIDQRLVRKTLSSVSQIALIEVMKLVHSNLFTPYK